MPGFGPIDRSARAPLPALAAEAWSEADAIKAEWRAGETADAAAALRDNPHLALHRSIVIDLAYAEYLQRERCGSAPDAAAFAALFPAGVETSIQDLIEAHQLLNAEPQRLEAEIPWPTRGEVVEGLEIRRELGAGAFGRAYLAHDPDLGRLRVLKVSTGGLAEARMIGGLAHPHVIDVLWVRRIGIRTAVCMPFVGAETLESVLARAEKRTPTSTLILDATAPSVNEPPAAHAGAVVHPRDSALVAAAAVAAKLARAVAYLHERGVAHHDLKPSNVVLQPGGSPQVIDFNLAAGEEPLFSIRGTPAYLAPELLDLALSKWTTPHDGLKADMFALGVTLVEWFTGRHPYRHLSDGGLASLAIAIRKWKPSFQAFPAALGNLLARCLSIDPAARPTASELADALDQFVQRSRTRTRRRFRAVAASVGSLLIAGVLAAAFLLPKAVDPVPKEPSHHERGLAALSQGNPKAARAEFMAAHEQSGDPKNLALAAYAYSLTAEHAMAEELNKKAITAGLDTAEIRNNRGAALLKLARPAEAIVELDAALALSKDMRAAKYNRAKANYLLAITDEKKQAKLIPAALADMGDVLKDGPFTAEIHADAARLFALAAPAHPGLHDRALDQLDAAWKFGALPATFKNDVVLKKELGADPRFQALLAKEKQPGTPPAQMQFVEPILK